MRRSGGEATLPRAKRSAAVVLACALFLLGGASAALAIGASPEGSRAPATTTSPEQGTTEPTPDPAPPPPPEPEPTPDPAPPPPPPPAPPPP
ncbi:MAG: hypothetical protein M3312_00900, partial [Actinomycetota bacterium]|nr:hypothetical protein [Actinomycetota bacterium]